MKKLFFPLWQELLVFLRNNSFSSYSQTSLYKAIDYSHSTTAIVNNIKILLDQGLIERSIDSGKGTKASIDKRQKFYTLTVAGWDCAENLIKVQEITGDDTHDI